MASLIRLATGSEIRQALLRNAGVEFTVSPVKVDEVAIRESMLAEAAHPRDIADRLAEFKAQRAARKYPADLIIGCDQVLAFERNILGKPESPAEARAHLAMLNGAEHRLFSAAVIYEAGEPVWRHVGSVKLTMRKASDAYLDDYVARNWHSIRHSVGGYKLEEEGVRLFHRIEGDHFTVLGLPLLELLGFLTVKGLILG